VITIRFKYNLFVSINYSIFFYHNGKMYQMQLSFGAVAETKQIQMPKM